MFDDVVRKLSQQGFKILLDLFASAPRPFEFYGTAISFPSARTYGESKLDSMVAWEYCMLLADKLFGQFYPTAVSTIRNDRRFRPPCTHGCTGACLI